MYFQIMMNFLVFIFDQVFYENNLYAVYLFIKNLLCIVVSVEGLVVNILDKNFGFNGVDMWGEGSNSKQ